MKNTIVRLSAIVLALLLSVSLFAVCSFADDRIQVYDDTYSDLYYLDGVFTIELDGGRIGEILQNGEFNKTALLGLLPSGVRDIINTRSKASVVEFLCNLADKGALTHDEMLTLFSGKGEILDLYINPAMWEENVSDHIRAAGGTKVNNRLRFFFQETLFNEVNTMWINDVAVYDGATYEFDHNALQTALLKTLPSVAEAAALKDGDTLANFHFTTVGDNLDFDFGVEILVKGDTTVINDNAARFVGVLEYTVEDTGTVDVTVDLDKDFTDVYTAVLNSTEITDARKYALLSAYTKDGATMVQKLLNQADSEVDLFAALSSVTVPEFDTPAYRTLYNKFLSVLPKLAANSDTVKNFTSIDDCYDGNGVFTFHIYEAIAMDTITDKISGRVTLPDGVMSYISQDDHIIDVVVTATVADFYRVRFFDAANEQLYVTYLPAGTDLSFVMAVADLEGHGLEGWFDKEGNTVTVMPDGDIDLYETKHVHDGEWQYDETEHWKVCGECGVEFDRGAHEFGEWVVVTPAGKYTSGLKERTCRCGYTESEIIPPTGSENIGAFVVLAVVALLGSAVTVLFVRKKKEN